MPMNSINTNTQALIALQSLDKTNAQISATQKRVSTGYRVADAKDDGGAFAVAQAVRSDVAGVIAVGEQLGGVKGVLETTFAALSVVSDTMKQIRAVLTRLADGAISSDQRETYEEQYRLLADQVSKFVDDATYNGRTLLQLSLATTTATTTATSGSGPVVTTSTTTSGAANGGDVTAIRNEGGGTFTIQAIDGETLKITTAAPDTASAAQGFIASGGTFDLVNAQLSFALNKFGASMSFAPLSLAAFSAMMLLSRFHGDRLKATLGARRLICGGALVAGGGIYLAVFASGTTTAVTGFAIAGLGLALVFPFVLSAAGQQGSVAISGVATITYAGSVIGPPLLGGIAQSLGLQAALGFTGLLTLAIAGIGMRVHLLR